MYDRGVRGAGRGRKGRWTTAGRLLVAAVLVCGSLPAASSDLQACLNDGVREILSGFRGSAGIFAKDLKRGAVYAYHADELFATASWFKLPVMVELFRRAEDGELRLTDRRQASPAASRHGSGVLKHLRHGAELSLLDFCRLMIIFSDNVATDTVMEVVPAATVNAYMARLGFSRTHIAGNVTAMHYRMAGIEPAIATLEREKLLEARIRRGNLVTAGFADRSPRGTVTTAREVGRLLEGLYKGEIVSRKASEQMLEILKETSSRSQIPARLPAGTVVAHKSGSTWRVKSDAGIVYAERGPMVISIFTYADPEERRANEIIARIAELLVRSGLGGTHE